MVGITVDGPLVAAAAAVALAAAVAVAAAALPVVPFAVDGFDDIAIDGCCCVDDNDDDDGDDICGGVNLKYLQQSHNLIVITCFAQSKSTQ